MRWRCCAPIPPTISRRRAARRPRPSPPPPARHEAEGAAARRTGIAVADAHRPDRERDVRLGPAADAAADRQRSEEHTSELQSLMRISYAVFCLKKKKTKQRLTTQRYCIC